MASCPDSRAFADVPTEAGGLLDELVGRFLEGDVEAALARFEALGGEAEPEDGLPRAGRPEDDGGLPGADPASHQLVEPGDAAGDRPDRLRPCAFGASVSNRGKTSKPAWPMRKECFADQVVATTQLHHTQPATVHRLVGLVGKLDDAVR